MQIGFDNSKYLKTQSAHIRERISKFGGKLYLEFGGKLFDDYHASRVLPGFEPDSKITMLYELKDQAEIVVAINAADIEKNKVRGDLGITYDEDLLRLVDAFTKQGLYVGSVVLTRFANQPSAVAYEKKLQSLGLKVRLSRRYPAHRQRGRIRKKRLYRDHPSPCRRNGSGSRQRKNGYLPLPALSRKPPRH